MRGCGTGACMRERNAKVKKVNEKGKSKQHGPRAPRAKVKQLVNLQVEKKTTLRNGNRQGNPQEAPRCGARTRRGTPCRAPAMRNGRCRMHGGLSTGPRTQEGLERCRRANWKHGRYSESAPTRWRNRVLRECRETRRLIRLESNLE